MPARSPILFWLLLAATLAVDAVSIVAVYKNGNTPLMGAIYLALSLSQLSVVCYWVAVVRAQMGLAWVAPLALGVLIAFTITAVETERQEPRFGEIVLAYIGLMWFHVAVALAALWLAKPTRLIATAEASDPPWRFAMRHLLAVMTCLAVLAALMSHNAPIVREFFTVLVLVAGSVVLLVSATVVARRQWAWLLRLAAEFAVALLIAEVCIRLGVGFKDDLSWRALYLIQIIVIFAWLELYFAPSISGVAQRDLSSSPEAASL